MFTMPGAVRKRDSGASFWMMGAEVLFLRWLAYSDRFSENIMSNRLVCFPNTIVHFRHYYEHLGDIDIKHYTQVLCEMVENRTLDLQEESKQEGGLS